MSSSYFSEYLIQMTVLSCLDRHSFVIRIWSEEYFQCPEAVLQAVVLPSRSGKTTVFRAEGLPSHQAGQHCVAKRPGVVLKSSLLVLSLFK